MFAGSESAASTRAATFATSQVRRVNGDGLIFDPLSRRRFGACGFLGGVGSVGFNDPLPTFRSGTDYRYVSVKGGAFCGHSEAQNHLGARPVRIRAAIAVQNAIPNRKAAVAIPNATRDTLL